MDDQLCGCCGAARDENSESCQVCGEPYPTKSSHLFLVILYVFLVLDFLAISGCWLVTNRLEQKEKEWQERPQNRFVMTFNCHSEDRHIIQVFVKTNSDESHCKEALRFRVRDAIVALNLKLDNKTPQEEQNLLAKAASKVEKILQPVYPGNKVYLSCGGKLND